MRAPVTLEWPSKCLPTPASCDPVNAKSSLTLTLALTATLSCPDPSPCPSLSSRKTTRHDPNSPSLNSPNTDSHNLNSPGTNPKRDPRRDIDFISDRDLTIADVMTTDLVVAREGCSLVQACPPYL